MRDLYDQYPDLETVEQSGRHRLAVRACVLRHAPKHSIGAEIGVFTGMFSEVLAATIPSRRIYLVDPWSKLHGERFPNWGKYTGETSLQTKAAKAAVTRRAAEIPTQCTVVEAFGGAWLKTHPDAFLGWVYLDANHAFEAVLSDLYDIERCLLPHGTIMGDDMWLHADGTISDVFFAVKEFCRVKNFELVHMDENGQWALRRGPYLEECATDAQRDKIIAART